MQVPYEVRDATWGKGVFASKRIPAGTCVWRHSDARLTVVPASEAKEYVAKLHEDTLRKVLEYAYFGADGELIYMENDDGRFFNHSGTHTNVALGSVLIAAAEAKGETPPEGIEPASTYTLREIAPEEELLDDYNTYHEEPQWYKEILASHGVDTSYLSY